MRDLLPQISYRFSDQVITILSYILGYLLAHILEGHTFILGSWAFTVGGLRPLSEFLFIMIIIPFVWWIAFSRVSIYDPIIMRDPQALLWALIKANLGAGLVLSGLFFLSKLYFPSRVQMAIFLSINILLLYGEKRLIVYFWKVHKIEKYLHRILLVGSDFDMRRLARYLESYPEVGYNIVGCLGDFNQPGELPRSLKVLGPIQAFEKVVKENPIEEVIVFSIQKLWSNIDQIVPVCEDMGIKLTVVPQWPNQQSMHVSFRRLAGLPLISFLSRPKKDISLFVKAISDLAIAFITLVFLSPLFLIIAIMIKWDSKGPVFYSQKRCGRNGREFFLLKFRSMVVDAEKMQEDLKAFNEMSGPVFKMKEDPRVTRVGRWLRRTSLDELPQLFNVLKGDLSLVGPRPPLPSEVAHYERWQRRRLSVKPGITCTWQISGRNDINFEEWIQLDLHYIDNWSLIMDLKILIRTIPAVLSGRGAR